MSLFTGESTASELRFPAGVETNDFIIDITVNVYDVYGDYSSVTLQIKVKYIILY